MDTSKEYIEMCEKAEEIQTKYFDGYDPGDYFFTPAESESGVNIMTGSKGAKIHYTILYNIWIPRQDQLQELYISKQNYINKHIRLMLNNFEIFLKIQYNLIDFAPDGTANIKFKTLEQYWLAFVMDYVFDKIWNIEVQNWIKRR